VRRARYLALTSVLVAGALAGIGAYGFLRDFKDHVSPHSAKTLVPGVYVGRKGWPSTRYGLRYRPTNIIYAGDGSSYVDHLRYLQYGGARALATGIDQVANCKPDCARSGHHPLPARVTLWRVTTCRGKRIYAMFRIDDIADKKYGMIRPFTTDLRDSIGCPRT
jgi:hypothetical protein